MDVLFIIIVFGLMIFAISQSKSKKTMKKRLKSKALKHMNTQQDFAARVQKAQAAQRSVKSGQATFNRYKGERKKRHKEQSKANSGLWNSKHRIDNNRHRRTDWGARGDKALLSPTMIGIIGGGLLTVYVALTALYG